MSESSVIAQVKAGDGIICTFQLFQSCEVLDALQAGDVLIVQEHRFMGCKLSSRNGSAGIHFQQIGTEVRVREVGGIDHHIGPCCQRSHQHSQ